MRQRRRPLTFLAIAAGGVLAAACQQVVPVSAPPPAPASSSAGAQNFCSPGSFAPDPAPTPEAPVEYVAVVDEPGPGPNEDVVFTATSEEEHDARVAELDERGDVVKVVPNRPVSALVVDPSDEGPQYAQQYGLTSAHADFANAWLNGYDGTGVVIAIVDSGVNATQEDLVGRVDIVNGKDFVAGGNGASDPYGHGTHVAGTAAASDNKLGGLGGAPEATILPIRVLNSSGAGTDNAVAAGIDWARTHGADVINLSLGGTSCLELTQGAINVALQAGIVVVAAGGNCGAPNTPGCPTTNAALYPAAGPDTGVIAVGATGDNGQRAAFSNFNPRRRVPASWPTPLRYIDVAAPGRAIVSTYIPGGSSYAFLSGTSMAAPHVAAAAALLIQKCPTITPAGVQAMLMTHAVPVTTDAADLGAGLIKMGATTAAACPP